MKIGEQNNPIVNEPRVIQQTSDRGRPSLIRTGGRERPRKHYSTRIDGDNQRIDDERAENRVDLQKQEEFEIPIVEEGNCQQNSENAEINNLESHENQEIYKDAAENFINP